MELVTHAALTDDELLARVARRDQQAFARLFERHKDRLYALAWHITRDRDAAEEAVQEAMLRLWNAAARYQPGNARAYLLKFVAREGMRLLRNRRSEDGMETQNDERQPKAPPAAEWERAEAMAALRQALAKVPQADRQLVVLACAGEISHQDLGEMFHMPRRTVSDRIQGVLERLRGELAKAGFSALAVGASSAVLQEAVLAGPPAPETLMPRVLENVGRQAAAASTSAAVKWAFLAGFAACALLVGVMMFGPQKAPAKAGPSAVQQPVPVENPTAPAARKPFVRQWTFDAPGQTEGLEVFEGAWEFVPAGGPDGTGCMRTTADLTQMNIRVSGLHLPVLVEFRESPIPDGQTAHFDVGCGGAFEGQSAEVALPKKMFRVTSQGNWFTARTFVSNQGMDQWLNDRRVHLILGKVRLDQGPLLISIKSRHLVDNLVVREIEPSELSDLSAYFDALQKIPAAERRQRMPAPGLEDTWFDFVPAEPEAQPSQENASGKDAP